MKFRRFDKTCEGGIRITYEYRPVMKTVETHVHKASGLAGARITHHADGSKELEVIGEHDFFSRAHVETDLKLTEGDRRVYPRKTS